MPTKKRRPAASPAAISGQLREIISGRGLTAYSVAQSAEVSPSVVSRFLSRERGLTLETFDAIAGALGLRLVETGRGRGRPAKPARKDTGRPDSGGAETLGREGADVETAGLMSTVDLAPDPEKDDELDGGAGPEELEIAATAATSESGGAFDADAAEPDEDEPFDPWRHIPGSWFVPDPPDEEDAPGQGDPSEEPGAVGMPSPEHWPC